jgi:hypothetical protein
VVPTLPVKVAVQVAVAVLLHLDLTVAVLAALVVVLVIIKLVAQGPEAAEAGAHQAVLGIEPVVLPEEKQLH